jgi:hypothetical protein
VLTLMVKLAVCPDSVSEITPAVSVPLLHATISDSSATALKKNTLLNFIILVIKTSSGSFDFAAFRSG